MTKQSSEDWNSKQNKILLAIVTIIITSWVPFYGYMYLNAYLAGLGFESVYVPVDIWEAVFYFFQATSSIFNVVDSIYVKKFTWFCLGIGLAVFIKYYFLDDWFNYYVQDYFNHSNERLKQSGNEHFLVSLVLGVGTAALIFSLPFIIALLLAFLFIFSVLGNSDGHKDGEKELITNECIYAKPNSDCSQVLINNKPTPGYVAYSNEKVTFFVTYNGRYFLNSKGHIVQYKPFNKEIEPLSDNSLPFNTQNWKQDISSRRHMLEDFMNNDQTSITLKKVINELGKPDSLFHYPEFPAYKLSENSDCSIAFPYNWKDLKITNVVLFGNCNGENY